MSFKRKKPALKIPKRPHQHKRPNPDKHEVEPIGGGMGKLPMAGRMKKVPKL